VQRALEKRGIPTVSVTVARDITERCRVPRAVFVPFMMGHPFGVPHHRELQLRIIRESLALLTEAPVGGTIAELPVTWAQARREMRQ
jgi:hypothetical protein